MADIYLVANGDELHNMEVLTWLPICDRASKTKKMKITVAKEQSVKILVSYIIFPLKK